VVFSLFLAFAFNITAHAGVAAAPPDSIGGLVWNDINGDGSSVGEPGMEFINVQLCGGTATTIDCAALTSFASTDSSGNYLFVKNDDYPSYSGSHLVAMVNLVSVPPSSLIATTPTKIFIQITGDTTPILDADFGFQAVPVPAAVWLFGSGLLGLISMARRKRAV
jgi:hypothetical protein